MQSQNLECLKIFRGNNYTVEITNNVGAGSCLGHHIYH